MFLGSESRFLAVQKECVTPPHVHLMSRYVITCDQLTASNEDWGEKAWVQGYTLELYTYDDLETTVEYVTLGTFLCPVCWLLPLFYSRQGD